jgi:hypothetical protein
MQELLAYVQNLMLEILPNHIENVAGISADQFLSAIPAGFRQVKLMPDGKATGREEFSGLLKRIWADIYFGGRDVLFSKNPILE